MSEAKLLLDESPELIMMKLSIQVTAVLNNYDSDDNYKNLKKNLKEKKQKKQKLCSGFFQTHFSTCREKNGKLKSDNS